jgi:cytochrome c peroxidase
MRLVALQKPALLAALLAFALGCDEAPAGPAGGDGPSAESPSATPWRVTPFPELPEGEPDAERVELGRLLFFDPILSADGETACATCHSEFWGMSDALPRSVGLDAGLLAGPGREGPHVVRRNSQALWNLAFREDLFWDGRASSLEDQAIEPLVAADEMDRNPLEIADDLAAIPEYAALFAAAFPGDPYATVDNLVAALAEFQRTFVSKRSLYDGYVRGDRLALSDGMKEGMFRFAEFGCDDCHTPPLFESRGFENRNVPPVEGIVDEGRYEATGIVDDIGRFRIPSLRNVFFSEPYFHNGSVPELSDAVRHELAQSGYAFEDEDVALITSFVSEALRDESRHPDRPDTVPSGLPLPLDGTTIPR